ncbi:hypothetical protein C8R47DRAFT_1072960 [Mycena vitilis]|nr:hypothetical protein C8R47DRAFT_1072960 [Mycena vitilis]
MGQTWTKRIGSFFLPPSPLRCLHLPGPPLSSFATGVPATPFVRRSWLRAVGPPPLGPPLPVVGWGTGGGWGGGGWGHFADDSLGSLPSTWGSADNSNGGWGEAVWVRPLPLRTPICRSHLPPQPRSTLTRAPAARTPTGSAMASVSSAHGIAWTAGRRLRGAISVAGPTLEPTFRKAFKRRGPVSSRHRPLLLLKPSGTRPHGTLLAGRLREVDVEVVGRYIAAFVSS